MSVQILQGDCMPLMRDLEEASIDAVITDPPYGLAFMGKEWDSVPDYQRWCEAWDREALRVLKPGGHLLAFGGTRTSHRLTCGLEDADFEIRDCLMWLYGSGYPKSLNVSKAIDRAAGVEREVIGYERMKRMASPHGKPNSGYSERQPQIQHAHTTPATDEAKQWDGWGTALKPGYEPIILARKPLVGTVAGNVLEHGTGALNVDTCRIEVSDGAPNFPADRGHEDTRQRQSAFTMTPGRAHDLGRWPANLVLDEDAAATLDEQTGTLTSGANPTRRSSDKFRGVFASFKGQTECEPVRGKDTGGASRFFYVAKSSRSERGEDNTHPTVKPLTLMRWLVRLITPPGGTVLDPFAGSGSTLIAAVSQGFDAVGMERSEEYCRLIEKRLAAHALAEGNMTRAGESETMPLFDLDEVGA